MQAETYHCEHCHAAIRSSEVAHAPGSGPTLRVVQTALGPIQLEPAGGKLLCIECIVTAVVTRPDLMVRRPHQQAA